MSTLTRQSSDLQSGDHRFLHSIKNVGISIMEFDSWSQRNETSLKNVDFQTQTHSHPFYQRNRISAPVQIFNSVLALVFVVKRNTVTGKKDVLTYLNFGNFPLARHTPV